MNLLWVKAFHIIAMVAWFAGLFYLPRLFVYHRLALDACSLERFNIMEYRLYYGIMWPAGIATSVLGCWLLLANAAYYMHFGWMHIKLTLVLGLWAYHVTCGYFLKQFAQGKQPKTAVFFRFFNEIPTLLLIGIVVAVVVKF